MGFYHPSTLVKDAQRHGLRVLPVDVTRSQWLCTIENECLRLGLNYVRGLRREAGEALLSQRRARPFASIDDLARRTPELRKDEMATLAQVGALNTLEASDRRGALWASSRAIRSRGTAAPRDRNRRRAVAPCAHGPFRAPRRGLPRHRRHRRPPSASLAPRRAARARRHPGRRPRPHTQWRPVRVAGCVIVRQRPGTAHGFVFLSLEDETGISNIVVTPDVFEAHRSVLVNAPLLLVEAPSKSRTAPSR